MTITTKIRRQGGAAVVTIPPVMLQMLQTQVGDQLSLTVADGALVARPVERASRRYTLSELLKGAEEMQRLSAETAGALDGDAVGREIG
ncbi:MAG: PbsX family transcriptional regulator [Alphaproteobacteria bacterium]|jgi:antitoxin ChpS|uniref:PbsX family transcriptional regulator n=1 Tax=Pseudorhizobium pelagicum TaxID=1509405 RepID=A0A922T7Z2_9HYPH|nr:PbsX family transcriptional regulator [Pseudorhizobium pelagicum]MBA4785690.1 PbsX family transcriptional regulator [Hyphomicrobiales bacterium]MBU1316386.1 PbsX family transcriptional regulator [Alphaproteobacteria bacterium]KEQ08795.1 PbsX family transcriptional regulator [Pseudorhizobium pelagicum]KEQ09783.1 PbsX family transcriptional regulator [Pseudorhizobium pelagicum]MBU1548717.1 PbsX family transcriptional regulator [Alphaproteobacteria bacterium]